MLVAGLVLGIVALALSFIPCIGLIALIPAIVAVPLGAVGFAQSRKSGQGKGMGLASLVIGIAAAAWIPLYHFVVLPAMVVKEINDIIGSIPKPSSQWKSQEKAPWRPDVTSPKEGLPEAIKRPVAWEKPPARPAALAPGQSPSETFAAHVSRSTFESEVHDVIEVDIQGERVVGGKLMARWDKSETRVLDGKVEGSRVDFHWVVGDGPNRGARGNSVLELLPDGKVRHSWTWSGQTATAYLKRVGEKPRAPTPEAVK